MVQNSRAQAAIAFIILIPMVAVLTYWGFKGNWAAINILVSFGVGVCAYFGFQVVINSTKGVNNESQTKPALSKDKS